MRLMVVMGLGMLMVASSAPAQNFYRCTDATGKLIISNTPVSPACKPIVVIRPEDSGRTPSSAAGSSQPKTSTAPSKPKATPRQQVTSGTAFALGSDFVVTNNHVVQKCDRIRIMPDKAVATVIKRDPVMDLAVLRTTSHFKEPLKISEKFSLGEDVIVAGYPLPNILDQQLNITQGTVSSEGSLTGKKHLFQISAPIQPGNSGGPVFNRSGNVIGVAQGKLSEIALAVNTGVFPQNINFAVRGDVLMDFLRSAGVAPTVAQKSAEKLATEQIAKLAAQSTVLVYCHTD